MHKAYGEYSLSNLFPLIPLNQRVQGILIQIKESHILSKTSHQLLHLLLIEGKTHRCLKDEAKQDQSLLPIQYLSLRIQD